MSLANMMRIDEDALICDLAETYHILDDIGLLPARKVAVLSVGLRETSRIKMKMIGTPVPNDILLLAQIIDRLNIMIWRETKDGHKGINRPESIAEALLHPEKMQTKKINVSSFTSPEDFWKARQRIIDRSIAKESDD